MPKFRIDTRVRMWRTYVVTAPDENTARETYTFHDMVSEEDDDENIHNVEVIEERPLTTKVT